MKNKTNKLLTLLFAVSVFGIFSGSEEPALWFLRDTKIEGFLAHFHTGNSIIFNLSGGFIISLFFLVPARSLTGHKASKNYKNKSFELLQKL